MLRSDETLELKYQVNSVSWFIAH